MQDARVGIVTKGEGGQVLRAKTLTCTLADFKDES